MPRSRDEQEHAGHTYEDAMSSSDTDLEWLREREYHDMGLCPSCGGSGEMEYHHSEGGEHVDSGITNCDRCGGSGEYKEKP